MEECFIPYYNVGAFTLLLANSVSFGMFKVPHSKLFPKFEWENIPPSLFFLNVPTSTAMKLQFAPTNANNYKKEDVAVALKKAAPKGVDCYFDSVGGEISSTVIYQMKPFGRVAACGSISSYNSDPSSLPKASILQPGILYNQLKIEGFHVDRWTDRWFEGIEKNLQWIREGKIKYHETVTKGFENMFVAFTDMLQGKNIGKAVVKV